MREGRGAARASDSALLVEAAAAARERIAELGPAVATEEAPELPPLPAAPIHARVTVETLRRDRATQDARLAELRDGARRARRARSASGCARSSRARRRRASTAERPPSRAADAAFTAAADDARRGGRGRANAAAESEAAVNKAGAMPRPPLDELRTRYEDEDRLRGDIERRIGEAERLLREGFQARPEPRRVGALTTTTRSSPSRRARSSSSGASRCSAA